MISKTNSISRAFFVKDATIVENSMLYGKTAYGADGVKKVGAGAHWQYVKQLYATFAGAALPSDMTIYAPNATVLRDVFTSATGVQTATITFGTATISRAVAYNCTSLESITLNGNLASATDCAFMFSGATALVSILGTPLNFTSANAFSDIFKSCGALVTVTITASTIKKAVSFAWSPLLSIASLLSIANGLNAGTPATLTMHATSKTNMDAINVDNVDGTAVLGTTMSLTTFITTIKGWTIA